MSYKRKICGVLGINGLHSSLGVQINSFLLCVRILLIQFLTAISFAIAVLEVGPKLVIFADLSFVEHCRVLFSFAMRSAP